ncbi:MAG TPA: hypothetical protein VNF99_19435 [Stellaceae bacterium]|nr:hypothetical protein [Stellaceae bacterium]
MRFVVDAPNGKTWFRLETEAEALQESQMMRHAVEKYFRLEREKAVQSFQPGSGAFFEQEIGLNAHIQKEMPMFVTLRDQDGNAHVTAMLPPGGKSSPSARIIIVGAANADPYPAEGDAIKALGDHFGLTLEREHCYPYQRG